MKLDDLTTIKLWGIVSQIPFESKYFIRIKKDNLLKVSDFFPENIRDFVLELGSGWGEVGIELARKNPNTGYILMEKNKDRLSVTVREIEKFQLKNIRIICCNFNWFLSELFLPNQFKQIILNFPDPWPKKKHWHNRTVNTEFISVLDYLLINRGKFVFATDHGGYGRKVIGIFRNSKLFKPVGSEYVFLRTEFPISKFEREKRAEKKTIYYLEREKIN